MDLEEAREKKLSELKQKMFEENQKEQQASEVREKLDLILRQVLEPNAMSRLANVKLVNQELYLKTVQAIVYLANNGKLSGKVSDVQLKNLLEQLVPRKKEISIRRIDKKS